MRKQKYYLAIDDYEYSIIINSQRNPPLASKRTNRSLL